MTEPAAKAADRKIIVYTAPNCGACSQVKGYLSKKGQAFEVRDITEDESAQNELVEMGFMGVPVTRIGNQPPILGADYRKIDAALAAAH